MQNLPDPKEVVDSVVDGGLEIVKGFPRIADNVAAVANDYAKNMHANLDEVEKRMPDDPSVLPGVALKMAGQTVRAGVDLFRGVGTGAMATFDGVRSQIERVAK